jgi:ATP-dependent DNA helicase RecG
MTNATLRERFSLPDGEYQATAALITELVRSNRILPAEEGQGRRNARYVPYWVGSESHTGPRWLTVGALTNKN